MDIQPAHFTAFPKALYSREKYLHFNWFQPSSLDAFYALNHFMSIGARDGSFNHWINLTINDTPHFEDGVRIK